MLISVPQLIVRSDRGRIAKRLLLYLVMVVLSALLARNGKDIPAAIGGLFLFACLGATALARLARPNTLLLDNDGIHIQVLRRWFVPWSDVAQFRLVTTRRGAYVAIDYANPGDKRRQLWWPSRPSVLPGMLERRPETVLELINEQWSRAGLVPRSQDTTSPESATTAVVEPQRITPWLSIGIALVLCAVFSAELYWPAVPPTAPMQPGVLTLAAFGGTNRGFVLQHGQWFRLMTAPFLHASLTHLLANCAALLFAGWLLEGLVGRLWFAAIYATGAMTGSIGSLLLGAPTVVGVGASGAIVALFAASYVCSFHFARSAARDKLQSRTLGILAPTMLTLGSTHGQTIDFGAHLGGAVGGALIGSFILNTWPAQAATPGSRTIAGVVAGLGIAAVALSLWPAEASYPLVVAESALIPANEIPTNGATAIEKVANLAPRYPRDPRGHLALAYKLLGDKRWFSAETEARAGLAADPIILRRLLPPRTEASLWLTLGEALAGQREEDDASEAFGKALAIDAAFAEAYRQRALLRLKQGLPDAGLPDAKRVTSLNPTAPDGPALEGSLLFAAGDLRRAIAAFRVARQRGIVEVAVRGQGIAELYVGDAEAAENDLRQASRLDPGDMYAALWLDIVRQRQGHGSQVMDGKLDGFQPNWPMPVVLMFAGSTSPGDLAKLASTSDQRCEAAFYAGEWNKIHGHKQDALAGFQKAATECQPDMIEGSAAKLEVKAE